MTVFGNNPLSLYKCPVLSRTRFGVRLPFLKSCLSKLSAHHWSPHQTSQQLFNYCSLTDSRLSHLKVIILKMFFSTHQTPVLILFMAGIVSIIHPIDLHSNYLCVVFLHIA